MSSYPDSFSRNEMIRSVVARKNKLSNEPTQKDEFWLIKTAQWLDVLKTRLKEHLGKNVLVFVHSGYRSFEVNKRSGGAINSAHLYGMAADITCDSMSVKDLAYFIKDNMADQGWDQLIDEGGWVHIGVQNPKGVRRSEVLRMRMFEGKKTYFRGLE